MRQVMIVALVVGLALFGEWADGQAQPVSLQNTPKQAIDSVEETQAGMGSRARFAYDLLLLLNNPHPTPATVALVVAWEDAEDICDAHCTHADGSPRMSAMERFNPLNTTQVGYGEVATINGDGVKGYATYEGGLAATAQTLGYSYYGEIVAGLQTNDPERALRGMYASPWGTDMRNVEAIWRANQ